MTGVEINNALLANLGNRTVTDVPAATSLVWINWTMDHIASPRVYRHPELETTTTQLLATGTRTYGSAAATGILSIAIDSVIIFDTANTANRRRLLKIRSRDVHEERLRSGSGEPRHYTRYGSGTTDIEIMPAPDATHNGWTLSVQRIKKPTLYVSGNLTSGSVLTTFDSQWDEAVVMGATWRGWRALREWERAEAAKKEFGQLVNEIAERQTVEAEDIDYGPPIYLQETM
jgi:hypothetical protein